MKKVLFGILAILFIISVAEAKRGCYIPDQYRSTRHGKCAPGYIMKKFKGYRGYRSRYTCVAPCTKGRFTQTFGEQRKWGSCNGEKVYGNMYICRWNY